MKYNYNKNLIILIFIIIGTLFLNLYSNNISVLPTTVNSIYSNDTVINIIDFQYKNNYFSLNNKLLTYKNNDDTSNFGKVKFPSLKNKFIYSPKKANDSLDSNDITPHDYYKLPPDLNRKEIEEIKRDTNNAKKNDIFNDINCLFQVDNEPETQYASLKQETSGLVKITKITAKQIGNNTEIDFFSNDAIPSYQKPEIAGNTITLRISNVKNMFDNFKSIQGIGSILSMKAEKSKNILIYKINSKCKIIDCSITRKTKTNLSLKLITSKKNPTKEEKEIVTAEEPPKAQKIEDSSDLKKQKKKWALDVIVLDPGHGGQDYGAVSINGYNEKDLVLDIGLKVRTLITENMPGIKVVMTRSTDKFIELYRRGQIANEAGGKLFVSIHLNSMPKKPNPANGCETYILRPGRNDDAIQVANKENAVIKLEKDQLKYKKITEEENIIATMAQSAFVKLSERFASILETEVSKTTSLEKRGVNQAGFFVLVGASMPNVLFEGGFLSNSKDEKYLASELGREKIALGIFRAIQKYAKEYDGIVNGK